MDVYYTPRSYQSTTPASNPLLKKKWDETIYRMHREKVYSAKSHVDNKSPKTYLHLHQRLKKYVMEEERMATIQKDNYDLLSKMANVMQSHGTVDNYNDYKVKSLNGPLRQRELLRIAHENQAVLARIQTTQAYYNPKKWLKDWQDHKMYMAWISKYPHSGVHHTAKLKTKKIGKSPSNKQTCMPAAEAVYAPGTLK